MAVLAPRRHYKFVNNALALEEDEAVQFSESGEKPTAFSRYLYCGHFVRRLKFLAMLIVLYRKPLFGRFENV